MIPLIQLRESLATLEHYLNFVKFMPNILLLFCFLSLKEIIFQTWRKKNLGMKKDIHFKDIKLLQDCVYSPSYSVTFLLNNLGSKHSLVIIFG